MPFTRYSPEPRPVDEFKAYIGRLTCKMCAGTGKLTTRVHLVTINGVEVSPKEITVRRCEPCNGWGVEP